MSIVRWIVGVTVFLFLLLLALENAETVHLRFFKWVSWDPPLVVLILVIFAAGVTVGLLVGVFRTARLKRQLNRVRREHARHVTANPAPPTDAR